MRTDIFVDGILEDQQLTAIAMQMWGSTAFYGKLMYPDRFTLPFAGLHNQIFEVIDARKENGDPLYNKIVIKAPRGIGKSSICKTKVAKDLRFAESMFTIYIGKSFDFASLQTESIRRGMLGNKNEEQYFKSLKPDNDTVDIKQFSKKSWMTSHGSLVWPRGCGQPVRGLLHDYMGKSYRLTRVIIDDLEDTDVINNKQYRDKTFDWLLEDVVEAVPLAGVSMNWQIIYIDTLKHEDSTLQRLLDSPDWKSVELSICDTEYNSLAPDFVSTKVLREKVAAHREKGTLDIFYREQMGLPVSREDAVFKEEYFKQYDEGSDTFQKELESGEIENVLLVDPAKSVKLHSADSSIIGVGVNTRKNKIYVRDIIAYKMLPDELYDNIFQMASNLGDIRVIGLEINSLSEFILQPFNNEIARRGLFYEVVELKPRRATGEYADANNGKEARISALAPYYRRGNVYHNPSCCAGLESQLRSFPRSKKLDIMDAFAYIVQLLEKGNRYFKPMGSVIPINEESQQRQLRQLKQINATIMRAQINDEEYSEDWMM